MQVLQGRRRGPDDDDLAANLRRLELMAEDAREGDDRDRAGWAGVVDPRRLSVKLRWRDRPPGRDLSRDDRKRLQVVRLVLHVPKHAVGVEREGAVAGD